MQVLSDQLAKINPDQRLVVLKGQPTKVWDWVFKEWEGVTHLVYEVVSRPLIMLFLRARS